MTTQDPTGDKVVKVFLQRSDGKPSDADLKHLTTALDFALTQLSNEVTA